MSEIRLLVVENNDEIIENYNETIKRLARKGDKIFSMIVAKNFEEAKELITNNHIDIAIIDLNLSQDKGSGNAQGNEAIREIKKNHRLPIYVITAEPGILDDDIKEMVTLYKKGVTENLVIFREIYKTLKSEIVQYFSKNGYLEKIINDFYWNHLSKTMKSWQKVERNYPTEIEKILSRHTLASLNEQLYVTSNAGSFDKYHPGEMYIIPPIKKHYHTGDMVEKDGEKFLIMNPACDIVNKDKMEYYTLAKIVKAIDLPKIKKKTDENKVLYINDNLKKVNKLDRYHFLPTFDILDDDYIIDFQDISIVEIGVITKTVYTEYLVEREANIKEYQKIASIASPFLKDIIARFSAYYARQGQPNFL